MKEVRKYVKDLMPGNLQVYRNMAVAPLLGPSSKLEYLVFDEAINSGLSVSETGSVPTLNFKNQTGKEVLILQGEYVVGGKQNRMVARNVYMANGFNGQVPVNCVQQRRWTNNAPSVFTSSGKRATMGVRHATAFGQSEVWAGVRCLADTHNIRSATENIGDVFSQKENELSDYLTHFPYTPNSIGIVVATQKNDLVLYGVDIFDQSKTLEKNFRKMIESCALEAIGRGNEIKQTEQDITEFLGHIDICEFRENTPVSLGRDFSIQSVNIEGSALAYDGIPVYITFNSKPETSTEPLPIPRFPPEDFPENPDIIRTTGFFRKRFC